MRGYADLSPGRSPLTGATVLAPPVGGLSPFAMEAADSERERTGREGRPVAPVHADLAFKTPRRAGGRGAARTVVGGGGPRDEWRRPVSWPVALVPIRSLEVGGLSLAPCWPGGAVGSFLGARRNVTKKKPQPRGL